jgi:hypothetical protein
MVACGLLDPDRTEFVIRVTSIESPDTIATTAPLTARFSGPIGPDLCSYLDRVEKRLTANTLELRFHGVREVGGGDCLMAVAVLDHEVTVAPPIEDPFTIRVLQPDGVPLVKIVRVR